MDSPCACLGWFSHYDIVDEIEGGEVIEGAFLYFIFCLLGVRGVMSYKAAVYLCVIWHKL